MPSSSIDPPLEPELGGRVAMEAGPRDPRSSTRDVQDVPDGGGRSVPALPGVHLDVHVSVPDGLVSDGPDDDGPRLSPDGPDDAPGSEPAAPEVEVDLRPPRRLRVWQIAPIVILAGVGSLMFAFPLAFGTGDAGAVVAMLGLLISCCAAGWGMTAARKVGHTWPGLPSRASGERRDWRIVGLYTLAVAVVVVLAVWRVARLR